MYLTAWEIANAIVDGEQSKLEGADLSKTNWFEVLQIIQGLLGEEIEDEEESCSAERDKSIQKMAFDCVRAYAADKKVVLPEIVE